MPIYKTPAIELTDERQVATEATFGEAFGAGTYSMYEGLVGSLSRMDDIRSAEGTLPRYEAFQQDGRTVFRQRPLSPMLDPEMARQTLRDNGLEQNLSIPDSGIRQATLDILMQRKRDELRRQQIMSESVGLGGLTASLAGALAGSFVDPTNIALAFVPIVGEAKYGQLLARAGGAFGRTGVRIGVGGAEGLVGLAPVEVLNYYAHQQQQSDYDAYDSMLAVAGGAFFGSALHGGAGLFSDVVLGGAKRFNQAPVVRNEPSPAGVVDAPPPVLDMAARERLMVLDRLAEGRPVTRAQVEAQMPRTGAEAGQIIDDVLAELQSASRGVLPTERVRELVAESDEPAAVMRTQEVAARDGILLSPEGRLSPEEMGLADARRQAIKQELDAHGAAQSAAKQLEELDGKLSKIDSDADLIRLTESLRPMADDVAFVDGLTPALRKELDADPFMPVRPFIAGLDQTTQAGALRMAIAQAVSGRPVDISPALYADAAYFNPESGFAAAGRNATMTDGASEAASKEGAAFVVDGGEFDDLVELADYEASQLARMEAEAGTQGDEQLAKEVLGIDESLNANVKAYNEAAACIARIGG